MKSLEIDMEWEQMNSYLVEKMKQEDASEPIIFDGEPLMMDSNALET